MSCCFEALSERVVIGNVDVDIAAKKSANGVKVGIQKTVICFDFGDAHSETASQRSVIVAIVHRRWGGDRANA